MPSSPTTRLRLEKQAAGENLNTWGTRLNTVEDLIEFAIAGRVNFALSGSKTLSSTNYTADEARGMFLDVTSGTGGTVTIPAVEKLYLVRNATSGDVIITAGGVGATIKSGNRQFVVCDATDVYLVRERDLGSDLLTTSATPTADGHLTRKGYVDAQITAEGVTRASGDASTLSAAEAYTDTQVFGAGALPGGGTTGQALLRTVSGSAWTTLIVSLTPVTQNTSTTLGASRFGKGFIVTGANSPTFSLDLAATAGQGTLRICNTGTGDVTVQRTGAPDSVDGLNSFIMYPGEVRDFSSDGVSAWTSTVLSPFYRQFTSSGTFIEPPGYPMLLIDGIGAGGGGGYGGHASLSTAASGGGGGSRRRILHKSTPGTSQTITIGAAGAGGIGAASATAATAGGNTTYGAAYTFYGGGPGTNYQVGSTQGPGGGGGGALGAGASNGAPGGPTSTFAGNPSLITLSSTDNIKGQFTTNVGEGGGAGAQVSSGSIINVNASTNYNVMAGSSIWGGGAGGSAWQSGSAINNAGGGSLYGGPGGGAGAAAVGISGSPGGSTSPAGGAAGGTSGAAGTAGSAGTGGNLLTNGGVAGTAGGGGGFSSGASAPGAGGAGGACGAGGGGAGGNSTAGVYANGGAGGRGELVIFGRV